MIASALRSKKAIQSSIVYLWTTPPPPPTQLIEAFYVRLSIAEQPVSKTAMFFFCAYTCVLP